MLSRRIVFLLCVVVALIGVIYIRFDVNKKIAVMKIKPDYSKDRTIKEDEDLITIDFEQCTRDRRRIDVEMGSTTIAIDGKEGALCKIYYGGEVENPNWDGRLPTTCKVPTSLGILSFNKKDLSVDLSSIQKYCSTNN